MSFFKKIAALLQKPVEQAPVAEPVKVVPTLEAAPEAPKKKRTFVKRDESKAPAKVAPVKKAPKVKAAPAKAAPAKKPAATKKAK